MVARDVILHALCWLEHAGCVLATMAAVFEMRDQCTFGNIGIQTRAMQGDVMVFTSCSPDFERWTSMWTADRHERAIVLAKVERVRAGYGAVHVD